MEKRKINERGITLISLVITIILLLILATVAISLAVDSDGLFGKAGDAANKWNSSVAEEQSTLQGLIDVLDEYDIQTWSGEIAEGFAGGEGTEESPYLIENGEQLAYFAQQVNNGETFEGKYVKVVKNIDLDGILWNPIGTYKPANAFCGIFDGGNKTISGIYQNGWDLDSGEYGSQQGLGLFGYVENATIKNIKINNAEIVSEADLIGTIAGEADGDCIFENIQVSNTVSGNYQYSSGGIVGRVSGNQIYRNITVDSSTTIAALWGYFENQIGGLIGYAGSNTEITLDNCNVAARLDVYNDVTSSYQWFAYRRSGMLIGDTAQTKTVEETTYADAPNVTAINCTVTYGDWANYTYCEFAGKSWPYVRVQEGYQNEAYSNPRYGVATDAKGNKVVDKNHAHNEGEDHELLLAFDQLFGGGQGVFGTAAHPGVTVIYNNR